MTMIICNLHGCVCPCIDGCAHTWMGLHMHVCVGLCVCTCICVCACVRACVRVCVRAHACVHMCVSIHECASIGVLLLQHACMHAYSIGMCVPLSRHIQGRCTPMCQQDNLLQHSDNIFNRQKVSNFNATSQNQQRHHSLMHHKQYAICVTENILHKSDSITPQIYHQKHIYS